MSASEKTAVIIDYGMGNVASVQKALHFLKIKNIISNNPQEIKNASFLILPGVGSFQQGMKNLHDLDLVTLLTEEVIQKKKPFLGICLGMQLIASMGTEPTENPGLNWINGKVEKITDASIRIPHLGWNNVHFHQDNYAQFEDKNFYFIHSYHFNVEDKSQILASVSYGNSYVAAIHHENIVATQFHPEKSQDAGLAFLKFFFESYA